MVEKIYSRETGILDIYHIVKNQYVTMKIKPRHIKRFESFIQTSKDPNDKGPKETKKDKKTAPVDEDEETQNDSEDEDDPIKEMKRYFAKQEKNYSHLWKSTI